MLTRIRPHLTYANAVATIALFVALGGGAYAAIKLPAGSVGTRQIKNKAVTPGKLAPSAVKLFKGQKGDPGAQGPKGDTGPAGTVDTSSFYTKSQSDARYIAAGGRGTPVLTAHIDKNGNVVSYFNATGGGAPTVSHPPPPAIAGQYFISIPGYTPDANSVIELTPAPVGTVTTAFVEGGLTAEATPRLEAFSFDGSSGPTDFGFYLVVFR